MCVIVVCVVMSNDFNILGIYTQTKRGSLCSIFCLDLNITWVNLIVNLKLCTFLTCKYSVTDVTFCF